MPEPGYSLSSEEFSASDLVRFARRAEADQEGFFRFYEQEVLPEFATRSRRAA